MLPDSEKETRETPSNREEETREAPSDPEEETREAKFDLDAGTQEAPPDPGQETREAPSDPEKETQEAPSDSKAGAKDVAGFAEGSADLEGLVLPARRKFTISNNPPNNVIAHVESIGACSRGRSGVAKFSADERKRQREECVDVRRQGRDGSIARGRSLE